MALMEPSLFAKGGNNVGVNKIGTILMGKEWLNMNQATSDGVGGRGDKNQIVTVVTINNVILLPQMS